MTDCWDPRHAPVTPDALAAVWSAFGYTHLTPLRFADLAAALIAAVVETQERAHARFEADVVAAGERAVAEWADPDPQAVNAAHRRTRARQAEAAQHARMDARDARKAAATPDPF